MTPRKNPLESDLPAVIQALAEEYHQPPETPKEEIWARIEAARRSQSRVDDPTSDIIPLHRPPLLRTRRVMFWVTGIAAILTVGIGLGRLSVSPATEQPSSSTPMTVAKTNTALAVSVTQHLSRTETLLTSLRTDPTGNADFTHEARDLLVSTRLMIDSRATADPKLRGLLNDLEFILVQIVQLDASRRKEELELITDGLEQRQLLPRIRTAIPAGPIAT